MAFYTHPLDSFRSACLYQNKELKLSKKWIYFISLILAININALSTLELEKRCNNNKDAKACLDVGVIYFKSKQLEKGYMFYNKSCEYGNAEGCLNVGTIYYQLGYKKESNTFFKKSCEGKNSGGCFNLAMTYLENKEYEKAVEPLKVACEGGFGDGCYRLGLMYEFGTGTKKSLKDSIYYLEKANKLGENKGYKYLITVKMLSYIQEMEEFEKQNRFDKIEDNFEKIENLFDKKNIQDELYLKYLITRGQTYAKYGYLDKAEYYLLLACGLPKELALQISKTKVIDKKQREIYKEKIVKLMKQNNTFALHIAYSLVENSYKRDDFPISPKLIINTKKRDKNNLFDMDNIKSNNLDKSIQGNLQDIRARKLNEN